MPPSRLRRFLALLGWTRHSTYLFAAFLLACGSIIYFWWPLAQQVLATVDWHGPWWRAMDWLLVGVFTVMTLLIMAHADLKTDVLIVLVAAVGGLVIEAWGTQTNLWFYYTAERPPLWIVPAWPIATLSIDRLVRFLNWGVEKTGNKIDPARSLTPFLFKILYWLTFAGFYALMLVFVAPTLEKPMTAGALLLCAGLILTPTNYRTMVLTFIAGAGLGYYLELWGTTRQCWTYYTYQTPPLFAVVAHGMAAVTFWRTGLLVKLVWGRLSGRLISRDKGIAPEI